MLQTNQERLYAASHIVGNVAIVLLDLASSGLAIEAFDLLELVGRLDVVVDLIRLSN